MLARAAFRATARSARSARPHAVGAKQGRRFCADPKANPAPDAPAKEAGPSTAMLGGGAVAVLGAAALFFSSGGKPAAPTPPKPAVAATPAPAVATKVAAPAPTPTPSPCCSSKKEEELSETQLLGAVTALASRFSRLEFEMCGENPVDIGALAARVAEAEIRIAASPAAAAEGDQEAALRVALSALESKLARLESATQ
jgi:hypothetical protein